MKAENRPACAADDEQVDVVRARHDGNAAVRVALVPFRQVAVVDPAVAVVPGDSAEGIAAVHPQVMADVVPGPAVPGDVRACSSPSATAQCPDNTALLEAMVLIAEQMVSRMPSGSLHWWSVTLCGASAAMAKTVLSPGV